jgi:HYR domain/Right handed beta helix region
VNTNLMQIGGGRRRQRVSLGRLALLVLLVLSMLGPVLVVRAATLTVTNTNDSGAGSLRQAIAGAASGDTITFAVTGTITLTSGELAINKNLTIMGPGAGNLTISGNNASRVFNITAGTVTISGLTVSSGNSNPGSAVDNNGALTVTSSIIKNNSGSCCGAIYSTGTLSVDTSTFSNNTANNGPGIYAGGPVTISNSTFNDNSTASDDGGAVFANGAMTIANSTFSGNSTSPGHLGGGLVTGCGSSANVTITNSTFFGNSAGSGGGIYRCSGTVTIKNTIVANNSGGNCVGVSSAGNNLSSDGTCSPIASDLANTNPQLGPLQNNGGPTQTHALLTGSPAINAGSNTGCPSADQRGVSRPQAGTCDIGAFEVVAPVVTNTNDSGAGSLRQAILDMNINLGLDTITFNIGSGPQAIAPTSELPAITDPAIIDGTSQPGFAGAPIIELNGAGAGAGVSGLTITASGATVRALVINRFNKNGILIQGGGATGNIIAGNYIGVNVAGTTGLGNGGDGVVLTQGAQANTIGGTTAADRNVISGNAGAGVAMGRTGPCGGAAGPNNIVAGNYIGTNAAGTAAIPNTSEGVLINDCSTGNTIGGTTPGSRNVISGNAGAGVGIVNASTNVVQGNYIGTQADGANALPNNTAGVAINSTGLATTGNSVSTNTIVSNGGLGIDLGASGITANDTGDADTGPNNLQNFPVITSATSGGGSTTIQGTLNSAASTAFTIQFFSSTSCDPSGFGEGQTFLGAAPSSVTTDSSGNATFNVTLPAAVALGNFITATATDPSNSTSEFSACQQVFPPSIDLNNHDWTHAHTLTLNPSGVDVREASVDENLMAQDQSAWFKFAVQPGARAVVSLANLPANYDMVLYKDIGVAYTSLTSLQDLAQQSASFAPDYIRPDYIRPDYIRPDYIRPDYIRPDYIRPDYIRPDYIRPDYIRPDYIRPDYIRPETAPQSPAEAYSNAQDRSLIAYSANEGAADELIVQNTWDNNTFFYVRVRGRNGVFSTTVPFRLQVSLLTGVCGNVQPVTTASTISAVSGGYKTIILTDLGRMQGSDADKVALWNKLQAFASLPEIGGTVINVGQYQSGSLNLPGDARVIAANSQADLVNQSSNIDNVACPYAKNIVASTIKEIVDKYRQANHNPDGTTTLQYIVIVGNDAVIPFFRHPEQVGKGQEKDYEPPVGDNTASEASLRNSYVLSQDRYGAAVEISNLNHTFPVPDLAVGRLVETPQEIMGVLDAYGRTNAGVLAAPTTSLVTGYDFMSPDAISVQQEVEAGIGLPADTLISAKDLSPTAPQCANPFDPTVRCAWTAESLRSKVLGSRHDILFLGGHFSQGGTLAGDYATRLRASEVAASSVNLENAIVISPGCHVAYNTVNGDARTDTETPDWAEVAALKRFILIGGTGYQYGDTEVSEYGTRLYLELTKQLRTGSGPVAVGQALVAAKTAYLAGTPLLSGIHEKTVLQVALLGLPMVKLDMPFQRLSSATPSIVSSTTGVSGPCGSAGLSTAAVTLTPSLKTNTRQLTDATNPTGSATVTATYLSGTNGVTAQPDEPVLPLELRNVAVAGKVVRGIGFRGGMYSDQTGIVQLAGAPATELATTRPYFTSDVFFPRKPWSVNYLGAFGPNSVTNLVVTPAQFVSSAPGSQTGTLRKFTSMDFRLYYSNNTGSTALAGFPTITSVETVSGSDTVTFRVHARGDPLAALQEVWVTYTATSGPFYGKWQSLDLIRNSSDSTLWEGTLSIGTTSPQAIRFMVQAVNCGGLVALDTNAGTYYTPGAVPPATKQNTLLLLQSPPTSGNYADTATFTAVLRSEGGMALANQPVTFNLGTQMVPTTTDSSGVATASFVLAQTSGEYSLTASFAENDSYLASGDASTFTIDKLNTTLTLAPPNTGQFAEATPVIATLKDSAGRALTEKSVFFVVSGPGGPYRRSAITDFQGRAPLRLALATGNYTFQAYFSGSIPLGGGQFDEQSDDRYNPSTVSLSRAVVDTDPPVISFQPNLVLQATGTSGAVATYALPTATDAAPANPAVTCNPPSGSTFPIGTTTVTCTATDAAGNTATRTFTVRVTYRLLGFYQPVDMSALPHIVYNTVKGGATVPVQFEIFAGPTELTDTSIISMSANQVTCASGQSEAPIEVTTNGSSGLRYDTVSGLFIFNWKTPNTPGKCYTLTMQTNEGSSLTAYFKIN